MRIKCPECQAILDIGTPKPGLYRPRCKHCNNGFQLKVSEDNPPKVALGKLPKSASSNLVVSQPVANKPAASKTIAMDATMDSAVSAPKPPTSSATTHDVEATMDATMDTATSSNKTRSDAVEETMAPSSVGQQTMDSIVATPKKSVVSVSSKSASVSSRSTPASSAGTVAEDSSMPKKLGGYRLIRTLGRGAMGAVYEAKQISLDRLVALKTIRDRLANNPSALARFTREAYAAAQLNHHNIVQIYDFGEEGGQHYFSMERVSGAALDDVVRKQGPLEARRAATYVLQAARGLQHAHQSGMVHRDIKPANLLLSDEGVVKVADLGLVKVPDQQDVQSSDGDLSASRSSGTQVTMMGTAVGTPAYMAPEQSQDATSVDHRADIYSLGCTLYYLLTGVPPFSASEVSALLAQHAKDPVPHVHVIHPHVPQAVDEIIQKSMAKHAADRYSSLALMIEDLEGFLGMQSGGTFSPSVAHADQWAANAEQFHRSAPLAKFRGMAIVGFVALCMLLFFLTPWIGFGFVLLGPACLIAAFAVSLILESMRGESSIVTAIRGWSETLRFVDWLYAAGLIVLVLCVALFAGCWPGLVAGVILGAISGAAYHFGLRTPIQNAQRASVDVAEKMIRQFRVSGADEDGLRMFVARYSGRNWGELFAAVFGVDALLKVREKALQDSVIPKRSLSLSERVIANLQDRAKSNRQSLDQAKLSRVEQKALVSEGLSESEARERAWQMAAAVMDANQTPPTADRAVQDAEAKRQRMKAMLAEARSGKYAKKRDRLGPLKLLIGAQLRLVAGVSLLALLAVWANREGWFDGEKLNQVASSLQQGEVTLDIVGQTLKANVAQAPTSEVPKILGANIASLAVAGLLLVGSAFISGWRMTPFAFAAAAVVLWGSSLGVPGFGPVPAYLIAAIAGAAIMLPGALVSERA